MLCLFYTVKISLINRGQEWWFTPLIPATGEAEVGGSLCKASLGKSMRPCQKNKLKKKKSKKG
jgi:hypothetical protein